MIKPKAHIFKLKIMLNKLEAVNNKVSSRCHASVKIQNEEISFKTSPQLKKNVALFNAEVQFDNFSIYFDQITGIYDNKSALLLFEIETQGTKVKIGEVQINLGSILNQKKYRLVNTFPLAKCYDKTAKVKLSVDFIPISAPAERNQLDKQVSIRQNLSIHQIEKSNLLNSPSGNNNGFSFNPKNYKSRLAQESNFILQEKIYQYQQKMDNYRLSQTHLQEKMHQQISIKDQHISQLTMELNRRNQQIQTITVQAEQSRYRVKELVDQISNSKETNRSLMVMIQNLQRQQEDLKKECESLKLSLENQSKTKENKQKYFSVELAKYTQRYLQSEQQRNKIVFELQSKFKQEIQKKQSNYRNLIATNDKKHSDTIATLKDRLRNIQNVNVQQSQTIEAQISQIKKLNEIVNQKSKDLTDKQRKYEQLNQQKQVLLKSYNNQFNQLQTLNFSYQEQEREVLHLKDELSLTRKNAQQLRMELMMANQTIEQQRKNLTKFSKELQVHQERQYYLTEKYNDQLQMKSIHEENIRGETQYYREEIHRLKNKLRIAEERSQEDTHRTNQSHESIHRLQIQLNNKNQLVVRLGEEKIMLETQNKNLKGELCEIQQALILMKEENLQMSEYVREKKMAIQSDKSLQWSYKIEELQMDISEMVEKFKIEKDLLKDSFRKEESKRKQEISFLNNLIKKNQQENEQLKKLLNRKETHFKEHHHNRHDIEFSLKQATDELSQSRQKIRIYLAEIDQLQNKMKQLQERNSSKLKELQQKHHKQLKSYKKSQNVKNSLNKVISNLLQYLTKPFSITITYQQMVSSQLEAQICNMINVSLRKYCQQRTKIKETIQKLQNQVYLAKNEPIRKSQKDFSHIYGEKRYTTQINIVDSIKGRRYGEMQNNWKVPNQRLNLKDNYLQMDEMRDQNSKLKRQISELRVKLKNLQDDANKAERNAQSERYSKEAVKQEMEEIQDQLDKLTFQLKRKEKIITEYQSQMKDMQTELLATKNIQTLTAPKPTLTRSQIRQKQKEDVSLNNRNAVVIRDLEVKLQENLKKIQDQSIEINKYKHQIASLIENINSLKSEIKIYETKIKERNAKITMQEDQLLNLKANLQEEHQREILRHQQIIRDLQEQSAAIEEQYNKSQQNAFNLQKQVEDLQKKIKLSKQQSRINESKTKRENEQAQARLKETIQELQHQIAILKSQIEHVTLRNKETLNKNNTLSASVSKKNQEIQKYVNAINAKNNEIAQFKETIQQNKIKYQAKIGQFVQKLQELQTSLVEKDYQLQEYRFTSQGKLMDLQKRLQQALQLIPRKA